MMKLLTLFFVLLLPLTNVVWAEGNCPPGMYPIGGQGVQGCAPGGESALDRQEKALDQMRQEQYERRKKELMMPRVYSKKETSAVVVMHPDSDDPWMIWRTFLPDAKEKALAACEAAMQDKKCKVQAEGKNISVALVYKDYHLVDAVVGQDQATAKQNAQKKCGKDCLVDSVILADPQYDYGGIDTATLTYFPIKEKVRLKKQNALKPR